MLICEPRLRNWVFVLYFSGSLVQGSVFENEEIKLMVYGPYLSYSTSHQLPSSTLKVTKTKNNTTVAQL